MEQPRRARVDPLACREAALDKERGRGGPSDLSYLRLRALQEEVTSVWVDTSILMSSTSDVRGNISSRLHLKISKFASSASSQSVHGNISGIS